MTPQEFQKTTNVSRETLGRFQAYHDLLLEWQQKINLIGPSTEKDIWNRHFFDSWQLIPLMEKALGAGKARTFLDLGSGAGLPGLVLALAGAGTSHLVEPSAKRAAFLRAVIRETGANAVVHQAKAQDLSPFPADIVTSRALADIDQLVAWGAPFLGKGGEFWFLKGKSGQEELTSGLKKRNMSADIFQSRSDPEGLIIRLR